MTEAEIAKAVTEEAHLFDAFCNERVAALMKKGLDRHQASLAVCGMGVGIAVTSAGPAFVFRVMSQVAS